MIIVTGGAGFIGSNLVKALQKHVSEPIVICDIFGTDEKWQNLRSSCFDYVVNSSELMSFLDQHASEIKVIFHLGGVTSTTENDADLVVNSNFKLSIALVDWCAKYQTRLIYASSASTYGDGQAGFDDDDSIEGLAKLLPLNVYGWSKHMVDRAIAQRKHRQTLLPKQFIGLKFFNVYGPNEYHKEAQKSVINHTFNTIKFGNAAKLFKSYHSEYAHGEQLRDFIWVGDCVDIMLWLYDHPHVSGILNVGTGQARTFNDLAKATFNALNKPVKIDYVDMPQGIIAKYQYFTQANVQKLRALGYTRDFTSLEDGIKQYVQNHLVSSDIYH